MLRCLRHKRFTQKDGHGKLSSCPSRWLRAVLVRCALGFGCIPAAQAASMAPPGASCIDKPMPGADEAFIAELNAHSQRIGQAMMGLDFGASAEFLGDLHTRIIEKAGRDHPATALVAVLYGQSILASGNFDAAADLSQGAVRVFAAACPDEPQFLAMALEVQGMASIGQMRLREGEFALIKAIEIFEAENNLPKLVTSFTTLGIIIAMTGDDSNAEALFNKSFSMLEKHAMGTGNPAAGMLAELRETGPEDVIGQLEQQKTQLAAAVGPGSAAMFYLETMLANLHLATGDHVKAEKALRSAIRIARIKYGDEHPTLASLGIALAESLLAQERAAEARAVLDGLKSHKGGNSRLMRIRIMAIESAILEREGKVIPALKMVREATALVRVQFELGYEAQVGNTFKKVGGIAGLLSDHLDLLVNAAQQSPAEAQRYAREALEVAQMVRSNHAGWSISQMGVRFSAHDPRLAYMVRRRQELMTERDRMVWAHRANLARPQVEGKSPPISDKGAHIVRIDGQILELSRELERSYTEEFNRMSSRPTSVPKLQSLLERDEAMLVMIQRTDDLLLWAIRRDEVVLTKVPLPLNRAEQLVERLRRDLEPAAHLAPSTFDAEAAHALYNALIEPVREALGGVRHILWVPDAILETLPLSVLLSREVAPSARAAQWRNYPWLVRDYAISVLPSAGSLRELRGEAGRSPASRSFVGIGNPSLAGAAGVLRDVQPTDLLDATKQGVAERLRALPQLPETQEEVVRMALSMGASSGDILLGDDATEAAVRAHGLEHYRIITFATHAIVSGVWQEVAEPALVLTPGRGGERSDDGLFTASEIAELALNADWVILSACNTASAGAKDGPGLSGLADAFLYAGARALAVSHWSVPSKTAVPLTTRMLDMAQWHRLRPAEALRRSMLQFLEDDNMAVYAHPAFWAPFVVIGGVGR